MWKNSFVTYLLIQCLKFKDSLTALKILTSMLLAMDKVATAVVFVPTPRTKLMSGTTWSQNTSQIHFHTVVQCVTKFLEQTKHT